jgi:hypothetical protein
MVVTAHELGVVCSWEFDYRLIDDARDRLQEVWVVYLIGMGGVQDM